MSNKRLENNNFVAANAIIRDDIPDPNAKHTEDERFFENMKNLVFSVHREVVCRNYWLSISNWNCKYRWMSCLNFKSRVLVSIWTLFTSMTVDRRVDNDCDDFLNSVVAIWLRHLSTQVTQLLSYSTTTFSVNIRFSYIFKWNVVLVPARKWATIYRKSSPAIPIKCEYNNFPNYVWLRLRQS